ncbi:MAG: MBL fold metallo-hydrolase [Deltaproteobacteria bacterium]|nr:MBL fold metallo-hydrolase [Deltaproteobacteria bacterium]
MKYIKKRSDSEEVQEEINERVKETGMERRDFLRFAGASVLGGVGALFVPGIAKASIEPRSFRVTDASGDTLSVLPPWKPYPYEVIPLPVLDATVPEVLFTYLQNFGTMLPIYCGSFFISGVKDHNIIIDSGPTKQDFVDKGYACTEIKPMEKQLKDMTGRAPKDIDTVIYTQMHHDHNPLAKIYTNAKQIVQRTEWNMLHNPPACYRSLLNPEYMMGVQPTFVHGDVINLFPGISLMYTPGHTLGTQSVVIDTKMGRVIFCGTCCEEKNFNPPEEVRQFWPEVLVPGLHIDCQQAYESLARIKSEADYIITPHDKMHFDRGVCPGPDWPKLGKRAKEFKYYNSSNPKTGYMSID